jgi:REP element-mobilizing transposase RayT
MGRPLRITYPGAHYHITARGNQQKDIFKSRRDREQFLSYLESSAIRYGAVIHAYCLMKNHYHLLMETPDGNLPEIMRHINGAYTNYHNTKRKQVGHLFQGRYMAVLIEADEYLMELSRYIHLNPVRAGITAKPEGYPWSSYLDYIGKRRAPSWLRLDAVKCISGITKSIVIIGVDLTPLFFPERQGHHVVHYPPGTQKAAGGQGVPLRESAGSAHGDGCGGTRVMTWVKVNDIQGGKEKNG